MTGHAENQKYMERTQRSVNAERAARDDVRRRDRDDGGRRPFEERDRRIADSSSAYGNHWVDRFTRRALAIVREVRAGGRPEDDRLEVRVFSKTERGFKTYPFAEVCARLASDETAFEGARPSNLHQIRVWSDEYLAWPIFRLIKTTWEEEGGPLTRT
jgi:hypothetical protein